MSDIFEGVFLDPTTDGADQRAWRVRFSGSVQKPSFNSQLAAKAFFAALRAGTRKAEPIKECT